MLALSLQTTALLWFNWDIIIPYDSGSDVCVKKKENCRAHKKARHNYKKYGHPQQSKVDLEMELDFLQRGVCDVVVCSRVVVVVVATVIFVIVILLAHSVGNVAWQVCCG